MRSDHIYVYIYIYIYRHICRHGAGPGALENNNLFSLTHMCMYGAGPGVLRENWMLTKSVDLSIESKLVAVPDFAAVVSKRLCEKAQHRAI